MLETCILFLSLAAACWFGFGAFARSASSNDEHQLLISMQRISTFIMLSILLAVAVIVF